MRIVHLIDYFQPKLGYQETFVAREQKLMGHDVYVVCSDRFSPTIYEGDAVKSVLGPRVTGTGFSVEGGIPTWRLAVLFEVSHAIWLRGLEKKIRELKPDIVHVHGVANLSAIRIALLKRSCRFKLIYDDHMQPVANRSKLRFLFSIFGWTFGRLVYKAADALVAIHETSKLFMHEIYKFPLKSIQIIPLGADDTVFHFDSTARQELRNAFSFKESDIVFVYAGKVVPVKGPYVLVEAALNLMQIYDHIKVLIIGNGPEDYVKRIKENIKVRAQSEKFIFYSPVPNNELYRFYSAADVAIWPRESSISMMEAMAVGLPIIISKDSGVTERVGYDNGLSFEHDDAVDLAAQMEKLLDSTVRERMGNNAKSLIKERFSWKIIAREFIRAVESRPGG